MRNVLQYPITQDEMLEALDWAIAQYQELMEKHDAPLGDIIGVALQEVKKVLQDA